VAINIDLLVDVVLVISMLVDLLFMVVELLAYQWYGIDRSGWRPKQIITNHQAFHHFEDLMVHVLPSLLVNVFKYLF